VLEHRLLVLRVVVLRVLGDVAELAGRADPLRDLAAALRAQGVQLAFQGLVAVGCEENVLQWKASRSSPIKKNEALSAPRGRAW
jgi:hypothetical protein